MQFVCERGNMATQQALVNKRQSGQGGADIAQLYSDGLPSKWWGFDFRQGQSILLFTSLSRTAVGPAQTPIQWVAGSISPGQSDRGMKLAIHLRLGPR
jgi:hypothetical protein